MAIANLQNTLLFYAEEKARLELNISKNQAIKSLALASQGDVNLLSLAEQRSLRREYKEMYEASPELQEKYNDYTEIVEFEEELDRITAKYQDELAELVAWETAVDAQITTDSAELEEVNAYLESLKSSLSSNIQEDFNFGLGS
jgi:iron-sulfur cluster repair protein YtfE (RIC family)